MGGFQSDISYEDFNPSVLYCSRVRDARLTYYHSHSNLEIAYILSGKGQYRIDGVTYDVKQGDLIVCNPGVMHQSIITNPADPTLEFVAGISDFHFLDMEPNSIATPEACPILSLPNEIRREISRCCYEIIDENVTTQAGRYYLVQAQMMKIMILIYRSIVEHPKEEVVGVPFESYSKSYVVQRIIQYLKANYSQHISLDGIAQNMYLSPVYISKIFKEKTGDSPINYLIQIRLGKAKEMLEENRGSIRTIAAQVGYDDVYHFSKLFKKYYGVSPLYYRKSVIDTD